MNHFLPRPGRARFRADGFLPAGLSAVACAALLCLAAPAGAQTPTLDPIVVTATRTPVPLGHVLADVTVLSREDIERQGTGAISDLLRSVPGFQLARNGGPGTDTDLYLRGGESRFTAVLIDGVRVDKQNSSGGANWQSLPLAQVERIEIVRGPASAVYGSDAISGVVQIFTRKADKGLAAEVGLGGGNLGTAQADASLRGRQGAWDFSLAAATERSDGFSARSNATANSRAADRDGYHSRSMSGRLGLDLGEAHRLELTGTTHHLDAQYDASQGSANDDHSLRDLDTLSAAWTARWTKDWRSQLAIGESADRWETRPAPNLTETRIRTYVWQNDLTLGAHALSATLERREDRLDNSNLPLAPTPGQAERTQDSLGLGYGWRAAGRALQLNVRHDRDSEFGAKNTGSLAVGMDLTAGLRAHASAGTGFRTPTLFQRFSSFGTAGLRPESSHNMEAGLSYRQGSSRHGLTVYRNRITDLIFFSAASCASDCYRQTAQARLQGATFQTQGEWRGVRLDGSLDLQSPRDLGNGKLLKGRTRQHAALKLETDVAAWTLGAQVLGFGERYNDAANTVKLPGYGLLNLDAQYRLNPEWRVLLRLDNALDRVYETARGYSSAPRSGFVGVRWTPIR